MNPDDLIIGETYLHVPTQSRVEVDGVQSPMHGDAFVNIMGSAGQVKLGAVKASDLRALRHRTPLLAQLDRVRNEGGLTDPVNHPSHYTSSPASCSGCGISIECIEITRHRNFDIGSAFKYLWRAGLKEDATQDPIDKQVEDLKKAIWYIQDEIKRITK